MTSCRFCEIELQGIDERTKQSKATRRVILPKNGFD